MKKFALILLLLGGLSACASNGGSSGSAGGEAVASEGDSGRKKVCKYERSSAVGSRMERVCRWVDTSE